MSPQEAFGIALILIALAAPVIAIGVVYYLKKRLEHKQIMAAIEKGTPLSELRPAKPKAAGPLWLKHLTAGIVLLAIALGFAFGGGVMLVAFVLGGIGISLIVRALLYRKYSASGGQSQPSTKNNAAENKI